MHHSPLWQDFVTLALVLLAAAYLARRWWPSLASLLGRNAVGAKAGQSACGQGACSNCSSPAATPQRDHRIIVVPRRK